MNCRDCKYWKASNNNFVYGECRSNPPTVMYVNERASEINASWPVVRRDDWCGKFARFEK